MVRVSPHTLRGCFVAFTDYTSPVANLANFRFRKEYVRLALRVHIEANNIRRRTSPHLSTHVKHQSGVENPRRSRSSLYRCDSAESVELPSNNLTFPSVIIQASSIFWRYLLHSQFVAAGIAEITQRVQHIAFPIVRYQIAKRLVRALVCFDDPFHDPVRLVDDCLRRQNAHPADEGVEADEFRGIRHIVFNGVRKSVRRLFGEVLV